MRRGGGRRSSAPIDPVRLRAVRLLADWQKDHRHIERLVEDLEKGQASEVPYVARRRLRELVFGAVRLHGRYDHHISLYARRPGEIQPSLRAVLWVALHEICEMKTSSFAAVDQAVRISATTGHGSAKGFVNAFLRTVLRQGPMTGFAGERTDPVGFAQTWLSHPRWLVERWAARLGPAEMLALCRANDRRPGIVLRSTPGGRERLRRRLDVLSWQSEACRYAKDGLRMKTRVAAPLLLRELEGTARIQDEAAQLVAPLCVEEGLERVLDLCAAPGGKASHLAQLLGSTTKIVASDLSIHRIRRCRGGGHDREAVIDGLPDRPRASPFLVVADGRKAPFRPGSFDAVLVDAPCTGTGVLARRHEARWTRQPSDLVELAALQRQLLLAACDLVKPGGLVVYATCSLESEENDEVVDKVLSARDDVIEVGIGDRLPAELCDGLRLRLWPQRHGCDGAFAARLRKRGDGP